MNQHVEILAAASLVSLLGCGAQPIELSQEVDNAAFLAANAEEVAIEQTPMTPDRVICLRETPVGSYIPRKRCYTQRDLDRQRTETHEWLSSGGREGSLVITDAAAH